MAVSARYRLPEHLGGGECHIVSEVRSVARWATNEVIVEMVAPAAGLRLQLNRDALTKVEPPLPPEPQEHGAVVAVGSIGRALYERDDDALRWIGLHDKAWYSWAEICETGTPVRLVPDPAAGVELPWVIGKDDVGRLDSTQVEAEIEDGEVIDRLYDSHESQWTTVRYTPNGARAKAAALLAAADAVEAGES